MFYLWQIFSACKIKTTFKKITVHGHSFIIYLFEQMPYLTR